MKTLVILGAGYVGLVTGACLADLGHDVLVCDVDQARVASLREGHVPFYEPGLADLVDRNQQAGRLLFGTKVEAHFADADAYFLAVGTPPAPDGSADLTAIFAAADSVASVARRPARVVVKSTVPVGTCDEVQARLRRAKDPPDFFEVVSNPEFLKEGDAINDFLRPDRIIVGAETEAAKRFMREIYAPLQLCGDRMLCTDRRSSELVKYASNAMLATRISFMNEMSRLCDAVGADVHAVRLGVGSDSRIGNRFLYAGPGYGGSCFPKDVTALAATGRQHGVELSVVEAAHRANDRQGDFVLDLLTRNLSGSVAGKKIALWGCAFKPDTDDVREAPALRLAKALIARGASVVAHDPEASANFAKCFDPGEIALSPDEYHAADGAHALVLMTEWRCYRSPDFESLRERMQTGTPPLVFDTRNIWQSAAVERAGLRHLGIGTRRNPAEVMT